MTFSRSVLAVLCACLVAAALPSVAAATVPSLAALELSGTANSFSTASVPKGPAKYPTFAIGAWSVGSSAKIALKGTLRFSAGKRKLSATRLELTIGRTSSYVSARLGTATVRLFTVTPTRPAVLDEAKQQASIVGAKVALTAAAAKRLHSSLKLKRTPSTATLGKLTLGVASLSMTPPPQPAPAPVTAAATAPPAPSATPTPTPDPPCRDLFAATPAGSVDWFGCDLPGNGDLHSWTDYIQRPFAALCTQGTGTIVATGGAARIDPAVAYDHRFTVVSGQSHPDGSATIVLEGTITYTMPAHGIDESIGALRIEIAADGHSGTVYADGRAKPRDMGANVCTTPAEAYTNEPVLTLDLTGIAPTAAGGVTRWVHVPAKIAAGTTRIGGGVYETGSAWGAFTIPVPAPGAAG